MSTAWTRGWPFPSPVKDNFEKIELMWFSTAFLERKSRSAITAFVDPSAITARTSVSLGVSRPSGFLKLPNPIFAPSYPFAIGDGDAAY
jgi:hypothetical protein